MRQGKLPRRVKLRHAAFGSLVTSHWLVLRSLGEEGSLVFIRDVWRVSRLLGFKMIFGTAA
jgi:hypothetical protein